MCVAEGEPPCADLGPCSMDEAQFIAEDVRASGIDISALQCHTTFISSDQDVVERNVALAKRAVDYAAEMGVPFVHTVSGPPAAGVSRDDAWAMLVEAYGDILDHASTTPVAVGIEPVFVYFVGNLATTQELFEKLSDDSLRINFDPSHFPYHRESPIPFVREFADRIVHAHAKDAAVAPLQSPVPDQAWDMGNGEQFRFASPGEGILQWGDIVASLREHGFDGVLSLELGHGIDDEERAARDSIAFFRRLLGRA